MGPVTPWVTKNHERRVTLVRKLFFLKKISSDEYFAKKIGSNRKAYWIAKLRLNKLLNRFIDFRLKPNFSFYPLKIYCFPVLVWLNFLDSYLYQFMSFGQGQQFIFKVIKSNRIKADTVNRYIFASNFAADKVVLDAACGGGFGTFFLAQEAKEVWGIDQSDQAVDYAKKNYQRDNIKFYCGDLLNFNLPKNFFDVIVSFHADLDGGAVSQNRETRAGCKYIDRQSINMYNAPMAGCRDM